MSSSTTFGQTAKSLSRNPLGILALFIVLVHGFAALVVGAGRDLDSRESFILVWFMVLFPVLVLMVFAWLVSKHHSNLYSPDDFEVGGFVKAMQIKFDRLSYAQPEVAQPGDLQGDEKDLHTPLGRSEQRKATYERSRRLFLVHLLSPSSKPGTFDVQIYLRRHGNQPIDDVESATFFFGKSWGNRVFDGTREHDAIGVATSAYGPFLCTCLVTFTDGTEVVLDRYVDFEMGKVLQSALAGHAA